MRSFLGRDILSLADMERPEIERVLEVADRLAPLARDRHRSDLLADKILVSAFYQPSTRTRLAHEAAMVRLGGGVVGFADPKMTRAGDFYEESLKDTVKMLEHYGDVIVMRHPDQGAPAEAARWASVPVINAGDGWGEHPTQVLTDLYTVRTELGRIDGLTFLAVGDWRMRTMHSLGYALTRYDAEIVYVCPDDKTPRPEFVAAIEARGLRIRRADAVADALEVADVVYLEPVVQADYTKGREERHGGVPETPAAYRVTPELLAAAAKPGAIVLHSLPRMDELPVGVDDTRHARYWEEAANGVVVRMALLALVLGAIE